MARSKNIAPVEDQQARVENLFEKWKWNPRIFVEEALYAPYNEKNGTNFRLSNQQIAAYEELRKLVTAKVQLEFSIGKLMEERFPVGGPNPTPEQMQQLTDDAMLTLSEKEREYARKIGISIQAGKGTGKDAWAAGAIIWFQLLFKGSFIPCIAPSAHQLEDIIWGEINKWLSTSLVSHLMVWQAQKIFTKEGEGKDWKVIPRTANPKADLTTQAATLSGLHARYMMVLFDEADAITEPVYTALDSTLTNIVNFALLIFNPTRNTGYAIETQQSNRWIHLHQNAEESELVSRESLQVKKDKCDGDTNANYYRVYVKGLPPVAEDGALLPWDWIRDAIEREITLAPEEQRTAGLDVGGGGDPSVLCYGTGDVIEGFIKNGSPSSIEVGMWGGQKMEDLDIVASAVDIIGLGNGTYHELRRLSKRVYPFDSRSTARNKDRFHNRRAEVCWNIREKFQAGTISIPNHPDFIAELSVIKYDEESGKVKILGKKQIRKDLGGSSSDYFDSFMQRESLSAFSFRKSKEDEQDVDYRQKRRRPADHGVRNWMTA